MSNQKEFQWKQFICKDRLKSHQLMIEVYRIQVYDEDEESIEEIQVVQEEELRRRK
jgi:hypothetical protein